MIAVLAVAIGVTASTGIAADQPSLKEVVRRLSAYVESYGEKASIVVATERYTQQVTNTPSATPRQRVTVADFAIVRAEGFGGWVGFRDVLEADGVRIADHTDRLLNLLQNVSGSRDEAARLSDESARFNLGPITRNFNVPTAALFFFAPDNVARFKFTRKAVHEGLWEIAFRETAHPTLIRTPDGRSLPSEGTAWVNASDGTVVRTRIRTAVFAERGSAGSASASPSGEAEIDVTYAKVPAVDLWLPATMTESYQMSRDGVDERTTTVATYSDYRVFQTSGRIK
jgi:hypothetical protein